MRATHDNLAILLHTSRLFRPIQKRKKTPPASSLALLKIFFKSVGEKYTSYVVFLHLENIEEGEGLMPKNSLHTYGYYQCHLIKGDGPIEPGSISHSAVPKKVNESKSTSIAVMDFGKAFILIGSKPPQKKQ
jgi:hypothetical protein